ncbi:MAG: DUF4412 domain-containing protein [Acidobacteria bacterium]|nr:DUF4412 domain-containing protein [Acidobacteriota bacterium]
MFRHLLAGLTALSLLLAAAPASAGIYYSAKTHIEAEGGQPQDMDVEAWVDGPKAKILFRESNNPITPEGSYLLTQDGGENLFLVNPEEKTYTRWDLDALVKSVGSAMDAMKGVVSFEISDPEVEKLVDEDGGTLLGLPTRHTRFRTTYSMRMRILGIKRQADTETVQDMWTTTAVDDSALRVWLRKVPASTGNEQLDKLMKSEMSQVDGLPLKVVAKTTSTSGKKNRTSTSTTTTEVTTFEKRAVPEGTFNLPEGYTETQMVPQGEDGKEDGGNPFSRLLKGGG